MISIQNLGHGHGARTLFTGFSHQCDAGQRYGVVGANGSGKSTLLRLISGEDDPTEGSVNIPKRLRLGMLSQDHFQYESTPILEVVMMGIPVLWNAIKERDELLANSHIHFDGDRYAMLEDIVIQHDGYTLESRAGEILEGLNIPTVLHQENLSVLSGGFKLRVLLAQALASEPDILLLDEPTNHLDIISIAWLERFLRSFKGCVLIVSHDRRFLNGVCTHIVDVDYERVTVYKGNYEHFESEKVGNRDRQEAEIAKREGLIAQHKTFVERFKAKPTKARQAQSRAKQMMKIKIEVLPRSSRQYPLFRFIPLRPPGKLVAEVEEVSKAFDEKQVLSNVSFQLHRGDRMAIIGPNGIGKSTLLKIMLGELAPDKGSSEWGHQVRPGYFSQGHEILEGSEDASIHDWLWNACPTNNTGFVRGKLAEVLFGKEDVSKLVGHLSGGEGSRLIFSYLGVLRPNLLILDEPTNHLDLEGIEALAKGLLDFEGTILFVSHDRWFVSKIATRIFEITPDGVVDYAGNYAEYLTHKGTDHLDEGAVLNQDRKTRKSKKKKKRG